MITEDNKSKFIKIDDESKLFESIINNENIKRSLCLPLSSFSPDTITECPKRILYKAGLFRSQFFQKNDNQCSKEKWTTILSNCKDVQVLAKNVISADCHYNISGTIDAVLKINNKKYIVQIQSICDNEFINLKENGAFKKNVVEIMIYMWLTEIKDGLLLYENKNTNEYTVFHIKPYRPIIQSVIKKCNKMLEYKVLGKTINRPYQTKENNECMNLCEFSDKCWQLK